MIRKHVVQIALYAHHVRQGVHENRSEVTCVNKTIIDALDRNDAEQMVFELDQRVITEPKHMNSDGNTFDTRYQRVIDAGVIVTTHERNKVINTFFKHSDLDALAKEFITQNRDAAEQILAEMDPPIERAHPSFVKPVYKPGNGKLPSTSEQLGIKD